MKRTTSNNFLTKSRNAFLMAVAGIMLCGAVLSGCSKDDDGDGSPGTNKFLCDGETVTAEGGDQYYYGHYQGYGTSANNVDLYIGNSSFIMRLELLVPNANNKLVAGTYTWANSYQPFTLVAGKILDANKNPLYNVTGGSVKISVSGDTYTVDVNCTLTGGATVVGNYTGTLGWSDESGSSSGNITGGNMSVQTSGSSQSYTFGYGTVSRMSAGGGSFFTVTFTGNNGFKFSTGFMSSNASATEIPAGTYATSPGVMTGFGTCSSSVTIPGSGVKNSASGGSFTVSKSGSYYTISFSYTTTGTPSSTISGSYTGMIAPV